MREIPLIVAIFFSLFMISSGVLAVPATGGLVWSKDLGHGPVSILSMTSDGSFVAAGTQDGTIVLMNRDGGAIWNYFSTKSNSRNSVVSIHPSGTSILGASGTAVYMLAETGSEIWIDPRVSQTNVYDVSLSTDGYGYSTGGNSLLIFNADGTPDFSIKTGSAVWRFALSSDGSYIATGTSGTDHRVYLYDRNQSLRWAYDPGTSVSDVDVTYRGSRVAAGAGQNLYLFSQGGTLLGSYDCGSPLNGISMSRDGSRVALGLQDGKAEIVSDKGEVLWEIQTSGRVYDVALSSDGARIAVAVDNTVKYYYPDITAVNPAQTPGTLQEIPGTGTLSISSIPAGAGVYIDNTYKGISPLNIADLQPGEHSVMIRETGYADWSTTVTILSGSTVTLSGSLSPVASGSTRTPLSSVSVIVAVGVIGIFTVNRIHKK